MNPFVRVIDALNRAQARYVIVGGFAAVMHGVPRVTGDIDLIIDLAPAEAEKALRALLQLGLRTPLPVDPLLFANPIHRDDWIKTKGMTVFSLYDPQPGGPTVDLFVENPIPFNALWDRSKTIYLQNQPARVCSITDLIELKLKSARPVDLEDIRTLRGLESTT